MKVTNLTRRAVALLAHAITKNAPELTQSAAWRLAWKTVKSEQSVEIVSFTKKSGEETTRVVERGTGSYEVKGTGRPTKPGQLLFCDLGKRAAGIKYEIISTYTDWITNRQIVA